MKIGYWILYILVSLFGAAVLELNHNTLAGWGLFLLWMIAYPLLYSRFLKEAGFFPKFLSWIVSLAAAALIIKMTWPPVKAVPAVSVSSPKPSSVIETEYGKVQGVLNGSGTVEVFAGIPYAAAPVGELRWRKPQDPEPWQDVRICDHFAPMAMQVTNLPIIDSLTRIIGYHDYTVSLSDNRIPPVSEDCLYLNIWKPAGDGKDLPVIVYIHGGSLQTGQPWYDDYSGETFAENGVIVVNMGYRLGVFGFLAEEGLAAEEGTSGNFGLLDQIKALEWVRDNIASFGGDPANVTLAGESAGAVCVDALCVSPLAEGLFRRAVLESSTVSSVRPPHSYRSYEEALSSGRQLLEKYGCSSIDELRNIPAEAIAGEMNSQHHITPDGYVFAKDPYILRSEGVHNEEALLHGFNAEESGPFILFSKAKRKNYEEKIRTYFGGYTDEVLKLYPAKTDDEADRFWAEIYGAVFFNYSHDMLNRLAVKNGEPVYAYLFSKTNKRLSCWHSGELAYVFGRIPERSSLYDDSDRALSKEMMQYWIRFAQTGNPNGDGLPLFEQNTGNDRLMEFGTDTGMRDDPYQPLYRILDKVQGLSE